ncbi:MAG: hypothetical protein HYU53_13345 [Acidobacteria bacterium]|nr:hypothetical protein [Acidobacteriota bacterium]
MVKPFLAAGAFALFSEYLARRMPSHAVSLRILVGALIAAFGVVTHFPATASALRIAQQRIDRLMSEKVDPPRASLIDGIVAIQRQVVDKESRQVLEDWRRLVEAGGPAPDDAAILERIRTIAARDEQFRNLIAELRTGIEQQRTGPTTTGPTDQPTQVADHGEPPLPPVRTTPRSSPATRHGIGLCAEGSADAAASAAAIAEQTLRHGRLDVFNIHNCDSASAAAAEYSEGVMALRSDVRATESRQHRGHFAATATATVTWHRTDRSTRTADIRASAPGGSATGAQHKALDDLRDRIASAITVMLTKGR